MVKMKNIELLEDGLRKLNIDYSVNQIKQFEMYYNLLVEWNGKMNLTSITDENEVIIKHFLDSLMIVDVIDMNNINSMIDIGTGAGFPSIPLKIIFPNIKMTLLDSLNKRITFLNAVVEALELRNIEMIHGRAEELGQKDEYRENYDLCVSRAVSNLTMLSEFCIPFIKINGQFISYKSDNSDQEIEDAKNAVKILGSEIIEINNKKIVGTDLKRRFVVINKKEKNKKKYPRSAGKIKKNPLR